MSRTYLSDDNGNMIYHGPIISDSEGGILLTALAAIFAASCLWLTVRIINRRERWAKWTLGAVIGMPIVYVLSFGPACWLTSRIDIGSSAVPIAYSPLLEIVNPAGRIAAPRQISERILRFANLGAAESWHWSFNEVGVARPNGEVEFEFRYEWKPLFRLAAK